MRKWTTSACLVIASCVLPLVAAAGSSGPSVPQASISIASSSASSTHAIPAVQQQQPPGKAPTARAVPAGGTVIVAEGIMPRWLKLILLLAGLLTVTSFLIEPVAVVARRRRRAAQAAAQTAHADEPLQERLNRSSSRIIQADHDRLIVTYSAHDNTVYLLTPPGEDPWTVLRAARVVVPEATYVELADHLGVPSAWPYE